MNTYDVILLNIRASGETPVERTVLQKLVYLQSNLGIEIKARYTPHYYGPYSKDVAVALADLVAFDFVDEKRSSRPRGYAYALTSDGVDIAYEAEQNHADWFAKIKSVISTCKDCLMPDPLSYAAKVHYIQSIDPTFTPADVAETLGWKMDNPDVQTGQRLLERLKLDGSGRV